MNMDKQEKDFHKDLLDDYEKSVEVDKIQQENREMGAKISNHKMKNQMQELEKSIKIKEELENEDLTNRKFDRKKMEKDIEDRKKAITFVNETISKDLIAAPGSLIVIASMTGNGKSTLTAKICDTLISENKKVLVLSNEEKEQDVRARVSCLRTGISFGDYKNNKCTEEEYESVLDDAESICNRLVVISTDNDVDAFKVTRIEGVMKTLEKAKGKFDAVIIDYYQNVNMTEMGTQEAWSVNNRLSSELNIFKDTAPFPIIAFAQCEMLRTDKKIDHKAEKDYANNHPKYRWVGGRSLLLYATDILELERDFNNSCSILFAHKVRFGHGDLNPMKILGFDKKYQRFVEMTPEFDAKITAERVKRKTQEEIQEYGLDDLFRDNR